MIFKQLQKLGRCIPQLNWKTWAAMILVSVPLFFLNVPGQKIGFVNGKANADGEHGKEFSHGWPFVAVHTLKPNYEIQWFQNRDLKGPRRYQRTADQIYLRGATKPKTYTRQELCKILNREIQDSFYQRDRTYWNDALEDYDLQTRDAMSLQTAPGTEFHQTSIRECQKPNWWYSECWPMEAIGIKFFWAGLACNLLIWFVVCATIGFMFELANRFTPGLFKFRLAHLFVVVGIISVVLATGINIRQQFETERQVADVLKKMNVGYKFKKVGPGFCRPTWLARLVGTGWEQSFFRLQEIYFFGHRYSESKIETIDRQTRQLTCIEQIEIKAAAAKRHESKLEILNTCPNLILKIKDWSNVSQLQIRFSQLESLTLMDWKYQPHFEVDVSVSSKARCQAITHIKSQGFHGELVLDSLGSLTKSELELLKEVGFPTTTFVDCTLYRKQESKLFHSFKSSRR